MKVLALILVIIGHAAVAQTVGGNVKDITTKEPLSPVTIFNTRTRVVTTTNGTGQFSIAGASGDTLTFSYLGYKPAHILVPADVHNALLVRMRPLSYMLEEFRVRPKNMTKYQADSADRRTTYKLPLQRRPPSPFRSPVSALAEKFSKKAKRTYSFQKIYAAEERERYIETVYNSEIVENMTGLTGDSAMHFMHDCKMPYDYARVASELEIKMWIRYNYREWLKKARDSAASSGGQVIPQ